MMRPGKKSVRALAAVLSCGRLSRAALIDRGRSAIAGRCAWLPGLAKRIIEAFGEGSRPGQARVERFILQDARFLKVRARGPLQLRSTPPRQAKLCPAAGAPQGWKVPKLCTTGDLARWLNLTPSELAWLSDWRMLEAKLPKGPLRHYHYRWPRLIESPKQRLKAIQRYLLKEILERIPPHDAAHGFRVARSIQTFVAPHVGRRIVLRIDLRDFFPSIFRARILAIFLTAGYPETVARLLTGICMNTTPGEVVEQCPATAGANRLVRARKLYQRPHLPQGARTSPALANLAAYHLDCRLAGLAEAVGAHYSRYADDLVFSGDEDFAKVVNRFYIRACAIALEEGFEVQTRKTRIMRQSVSQRAAGVVLNQHANVPRAFYEKLKAIIHNCITHGPNGQNRSGVADFRAHLAGRIAHVTMLNPARGQKLQKEFDRIDWNLVETDR